MDADIEGESIRSSWSTKILNYLGEIFGLRLKLVLKLDFVIKYYLHNFEYENILKSTY